MLTHISLLCLAFLPFVFAQGQYLTGLLQALNSSGLTELGSILPTLNGTTAGQALFSDLPNGNWTLFAPNDAALSAVPMDITSNLNMLADIISYHVVAGNFTNETMTYPNVTVGRTLLNDSSLVMLEGNKSQALVWSKMSNGTIMVLNDNMNVSVTNMTMYQNVEILIIDSVLLPPPNISTVLSNASYDLTSLSTVLSQATLPNSSTTLAEALTSARGFTAFAPNNEALAASQSTLSGLMSNMTALSALLSNHVINGTSVYSSEISSSANYTSAAGEPFMFMTNSSGTYVSSGGSSARIVRSDVLLQNGVVHVIDGVLADTQSNAAAASSAYASATSVAAVTVTQTGPVGPTGTSGSGSGGTSGKPNSARMVGAGLRSALGVAVVFSVLGQML